MSRLPTVTFAPAPGDSDEHRAVRRRLFALAFLGAALIGAAAGLIDTRTLP